MDQLADHLLVPSLTSIKRQASEVFSISLSHWASPFQAQPFSSASIPSISSFGLWDTMTVSVGIPVASNCPNIFLRFFDIRMGSTPTTAVPNSGR